MRKLIITALAVMSACALIAAPDSRTDTMALGAKTGGTNVVSGLRGYVEAVYVSVTDGVSTGDVVVAYIPLDGVSAAVNVATNSVVGAKTWRPRVDGTDVAGAALTSDPPGRFLLDGDALRWVVTGSPTNKVWRLTIKMDK